MNIYVMSSLNLLAMVGVSANTLYNDIFYGLICRTANIFYSLGLSKNDLQTDIDIYVCGATNV